MMIVYSKKHTEVCGEMKRRLICDILDYAEEQGISNEFIMDSQTIQDSIASISSRVASLSESVVIDKDLIRMRKESDEFKKAIEQDEIKTAMESMAKVDRKLRKTEKPHAKKGGVNTR